MVRDEQYFIDYLKTENYYEMFLCIAQYSTKYIPKPRWVNITPVDKEIIIKVLSEKFFKNKELIENDINRLIRIGLIEYVYEEENPYRNNATDDEDSERIAFIIKENENIEQKKIQLTENMQISGRSLYLKICSEEDEEKDLKKRSKEIQNIMENMFNELYQPHQKEIDDMQKKIEANMNKAEKTYENIEKNLGDSIVKNIQVLSIFAGLIAILFSNIIAIKEVANNGAMKTIIILNLSIICILFFLIIITRLIIINKDKKSFYFSVILFLIIGILLFLLIA